MGSLIVLQCLSVNSYTEARSIKALLICIEFLNLYFANSCTFLKLKTQTLQCVKHTQICIKRWTNVKCLRNHWWFHSVRLCLPLGLNHQPIFVCLELELRDCTNLYFRVCSWLRRCCCFFWASWVTGACRTERYLEPFTGQEVLWASLVACPALHLLSLILLQSDTLFWLCCPKEDGTSRH